MRQDVGEDWSWADGYLPEVQRILTLSALKLLTVEIATTQEDLNKATDLVLRVSGSKAIAVRLRRVDYAYRDLTIRASRTSGATTELSKIRQGHGDYYLYGWTKGLTITEWMLVDLAALRACGLLERPWKLISNKEGLTNFIAIPYSILQDAGCLIASHISRSE